MELIIFNLVGAMVVVAASLAIHRVGMMKGYVEGAEDYEELAGLAIAVAEENEKLRAKLLALDETHS